MNSLIYPIALVILDGWGYSESTQCNAIYHAHPTMFNYLWNNYPHTLLKASGKAVGLPAGYIGNSEVGHLTIGAGRIIPQSLTRINQMISDKTFFEHPILKEKFTELKKHNSALHLVGLLSDGGVHSHENHLYALIKAAAQHNISSIFVHAFLDGRDVPPQSAEKYLKKLEEQLQKIGVGKLASITGRFYAMDRDKNWDRTKKTYDTLIGTLPATHETWQSILQKNYANGITDEFIPPTLLEKNAHIKRNDEIIFFNFRADRMRQLTELFLNFLPNTTVLSMTRYHKQFINPILLTTKDVHETLFDYLEKKNKTIFTIAETEKYAHVTYFFNGGKEIQRKNETRILVPSHPEKTYEKHPRMSADMITEKVLESLKHNPHDFYLINYANADMVAHSGNFKSTVQAIQCLDEQLKKLYRAFIEQHQGTVLITADHGNAEEMCDATGTKTSHTTNQVPFIYIQKKLHSKKEQLLPQQLADIAPFIKKL